VTSFSHLCPRMDEVFERCEPHTQKLLDARVRAGGTDVERDRGSGADDAVRRNEHLKVLRTTADRGRRRGARSATPHTPSRAGSSTDPWVSKYAEVLGRGVIKRPQADDWEVP